MRTSLKEESVPNTTIFEKTIWRLPPFCILVNAFKLVCSSFVDAGKLKTLEKFKIHNQASEIATS